MRQIGACLTDAALSVAFLGAALQLRRRCRPRPGRRTAPRWCTSFVWAYVSGGLSCACGCGVWGLDLNLKTAPEFAVWEMAVADGMAVGMFGEALALVAACWGVQASVSERAFSLWARVSALLLVVCCGYMVVGHSIGLSISYLLLPCASVGAALAVLVPVSCAHALGYIEGVDGRAQSCWQWISLGSVLNLAGASLLGAMDNDCAGPCCITEPFPWESSPCRWNTASPPGSSCPLPEAFNHAAVMHLFAIAGIACTTHGLKGLLDCGWEPSPPAAKKHSQ